MKINEKNLCEFSKTPPFDLEGFLNKRGEVNKAWQKRYFVLKGNLLFYFEKRGDKEPLGLIIVEGCTIELAEEGLPYSFQIVFNGNRTYTLSADSQDSMELWMKSLTCAGYEYKKLMAAELQRQLDELEELQKKRNLEQIQSTAPRPPPRRQNPFNRPAPPPPLMTNSINTTSTANANLFSLDDVNDVAGNSSSSLMTTTATAKTMALASKGSATEQNFLLDDFFNASTSTSHPVATASATSILNASGIRQGIALLDNNITTIATTKTKSKSKSSSLSSSSSSLFEQQQQQPSTSINNVNNLLFNDDEEINFHKLHSMYKNIIFKDLNAYRKQKENANKPLIEF